MTDYIFSYHSPDRLGLHAQVLGFFYESGAFIKETATYNDSQSEEFFSRCVFDDRVMTLSIEQFTERLGELASSLNLTYQLRRLDGCPRVLIAVSTYDHCLNALLLKWKSGVLAIDIVGVVSNHEVCRELVEWYGIPFHYLPISAETKPKQEQQILNILEQERVDLFVLARYMQILSDNLCAKLDGRAINIHHSFLPGFKGAKPYHQAYERGVKVIGATAHFVNRDLDEGPIIVQEVKPIDHEVSVEKMVHMGHDIEANALSQAVQLFAEMRILSNGQRTVIF